MFNLKQALMDMYNELYPGEDRVEGTPEYLFRMILQKMISNLSDILKYTNISQFPVSGISGKLYLAQDTNKIYKWNGTTYEELGSSSASIENYTKYFTIADFILEGGEYKLKIPQSDHTFTSFDTNTYIISGGIEQEVSASIIVDETTKETVLNVGDINNRFDGKIVFIKL